MEHMTSMEFSNPMAELAAALVAAQAEIANAAKDAMNPHFNKPYADLSSVMEACKPALNKHGIAIIQAPVPADGNRAGVETMFLHKSGQWVKGRAEVPMGRADPQGYGSAMTYARRYSLAAMAGVCPEDDDAEGAMGRGKATAGASGKALPAPQEQKPAGKPRTQQQDAQLRAFWESIDEQSRGEWVQYLKANFKVERFSALNGDQAAEVIKLMPPPQAA